MKKELNSVDVGEKLNILDIIDTLPFYVLLVDDQHNIIIANNAVREHLDVDPEEIVGKYCPKVVHGIDTPFEGCPLEEAVITGRGVVRELLDKASGRWVRSSVYPTRALTRDGRKVFLHMVVDITDRKEAEAQLIASHKRLRSVSQHLESVREEEKRKIAHDLHDETSQVVATINTYLESAITKLPPGSGDVGTLLVKAQALSVQIHDQLHNIIYELRPSILDDFGLVAAITWLTKSTLEEAGIQVQFKIFRQEKRLPPDLRIALFRVVQESISNILKYARATNVTISLHFSKKTIKISIEDNGVGFDVEKTLSSRVIPGGLGILGMKERVELFGGTFDISSKPHGGTEINIEIPLKNDAAKE